MDDSPFFFPDTVNIAHIKKNRILPQTYILKQELYVWLELGSESRLVSQY